MNLSRQAFRRCAHISTENTHLGMIESSAAQPDRGLKFGRQSNTTWASDSESSRFAANRCSEVKIRMSILTHRVRWRTEEDWTYFSTLRCHSLIVISEERGTKVWSRSMYPMISRAFGQGRHWMRKWMYGGWRRYWSDELRTCLDVPLSPLIWFVSINGQLKNDTSKFRLLGRNSPSPPVPKSSLFTFRRRWNSISHSTAVLLPTLFYWNEKLRCSTLIEILELQTHTYTSSPCFFHSFFSSLSRTLDRSAIRRTCPFPAISVSVASL